MDGDFKYLKIQPKLYLDDFQTKTEYHLPTRVFLIISSFLLLYQGKIEFSIFIIIFSFEFPSQSFFGRFPIFYVCIEICKFSFSPFTIKWMCGMQKEEEKGAETSRWTRNDESRWDGHFSEKGLNKQSLEKYFFTFETYSCPFRMCVRIFELCNVKWKLKGFNGWLPSCSPYFSTFCVHRELFFTLQHDARHTLITKREWWTEERNKFLKFLIYVHITHSISSSSFSPE